jgi:argininosuccinate synthase
VVDARERFVTDFVWPHLQANALYQGAYPLATALARPLIAQLLVEVAHREGADAVAHGCTGKGNDQVRFDVATHALDPGLEVVAPMRVGMGLTREQEIDYAEERGIEIPITKASPYSIDVNLWGRSCEDRCPGGSVGHAPGRRLRVDRRAGLGARPVEVLIEFEGGVPVALDGERLPPVELVERLHALGGAHGAPVGSTTSRIAWSGSRAARSTRRPAATILHAAHRALESLTLSRDTLRFDRLVADELARLIYDGLWFSALSRDLRAYVASSQRVVSGEVRVRLGPRQRGCCRAALAAVAVRQVAGHVRRGRCLRPRLRRSGSSRSSACRCESRLPGTERSASITVRQWTWTDPLLADLPTSVTDPERPCLTPRAARCANDRVGRDPPVPPARAGGSTELGFLH